MLDELFEYLRQILYEPDRATIDLEPLPNDQRPLAQGLQYLQECMKEQRVFAKGLAHGDMKTPLPSSSNPLAGELRGLHSALTHLIWQARQVTKGDYGQKLDFFGELSDVFNAMTEQLNDRERRLAQEAAVIKARNEALSQEQELLVALTNQMTDWILVTDPLQTIRYVNNVCRQTLDKIPLLEQQLCQLLAQGPVGREAIHWELSVNRCQNDGSNGVFSVRSQEIHWDGEICVLHLLRDITQDRELELLAFQDPLTRLFNRRYGMAEIKRRIEHGEHFQLAFIDVDLLKKVNDELGHEAGNAYILDIANVLRQLRDPKLICRIGGDEFLVVTGETPPLGIALEAIRTTFVESATEYSRSFSYGIVDTRNDGQNITTLLHKADVRMYQYKIEHKRQRVAQ